MTEDEYPVVSIEALADVGIDITEDAPGVNRLVPTDDWTDDPQ